MYEDLFNKLQSRNTLEENIHAVCEGMTWEQIALALYGILDDIDTLDDACRENSEAFRNVVMKLQAKKNEFLYSPDGYVIEPVVEIEESLTDFAKYELDLAGMFDKDSDYEGMLGEAVMDLIELFADQGHSGFSAAWTVQLFDRLARYKPLTELTDNLDEWNDLHEEFGKDVRGMRYQSRRSPSCFSNDGGETYWDIDEDYYKHTDEDGTVLSGGLSEEEWSNRPIHKSKHRGEENEAK